MSADTLVVLTLLGLAVGLTLAGAQRVPDEGRCRECRQWLPLALVVAPLARCAPCCDALVQKLRSEGRADEAASIRRVLQAWARRPLSATNHEGS